MNKKYILFFQWFLVISFILSFTLVSILVYWYYRPNTSYLNDDLDLESWDVVADGSHNSNTDMIEWKNEFYLIHAASPFHLGTSESKLVIRKSSDAKDWEKVTEIDLEGDQDIRDPKFANISNILFCYCLVNEPGIANPYKTMYSSSEDGKDWTEWKDLKGDADEGWLFWRPKTPDNGTTWYVPAYWWEHGKSRLFQSTDGIEWEKVSDIYSGETNDETAIEFYPDGKMISTARLEGITDINLIGDSTGSTLISVADNPYDKWEQVKSRVTRLDGPYLFEYNGKIYAAGRFEPDARGIFTEMGSFFNRKRTSLFLIEKDKITYLSDLPSNGDTAYCGVVQKDGYAYISYYTNYINKDMTWIEGIISPTNIRIAKVMLSKLEKVAEDPPDLPSPSPIKIDNLILHAGLISVIVVILGAIWRERQDNRNRK